MEQYVFMSIHMQNRSATTVMRDILSMDHHGEHVNLMVPGVDSTLLVEVSTILIEITTHFTTTDVRMYE